MKGDKILLEEILSFGIEKDIVKKNKDGKTPYHYLLQNGNVRSMFETAIPKFREYNCQNINLS